MAKLDWVVSPAIAGYYDVVNTTSPLLHAKIGDIDFRKITLAQADLMYSQGTGYLKKVISKDKKSKMLTK